MNQGHPKLPQERAENVIFALFLAALAVAPLWLGSNRVGAWGLNAILYPALAMAFEIVLIWRSQAHPVAVGKIAIPAVGFALVVAWMLLQITDLAPVSWHHPIWAITAENLGRPVAGSIGVNPDASLLALMRLTTCASAFWLALHFSRDRRRAALLLETLAAIGAVYAAYGLVSFFAVPEKLLWFEKTAYLESVTSTFVNRNNFATFAGITLIASVATAANILYRKIDQAGPSPTSRLTVVIHALIGRVGIHLLGILIISSALVMTGSRAGILSSFAGLLVLVVLLVFREGSGRGGRLMIAALSAIIIVVVLANFGDLLASRIGSFYQGDTTSRGVTFALVIRSILDAPLLGFGVGSFADVFTMYRDATIPQGTWDHAHNTYLELIQGLGIPFAAVLFAAVGYLIALCIKGAFARRRDFVFCLGAVAASVLVVLHALVDFSLEIQAVALFWYSILGAGVAQSYSSRIR